MNLVRVKDLVGKSGFKADMRTRCADGSLRYGSVDTEQEPRIVTVTKVTWKIPNKSECRRGYGGRWDGKTYWLHLWYTPCTVGCGFSGRSQAIEESDPWFILAEVDE